MPFYSIPCGSNSHKTYLEPHRPPFESSCRKYIWIILLRSNTNDSCSGFHTADCNLQQCRPWCAAGSACISTVCWMVVYSAPSRETAIVWNQPEDPSWTTCEIAQILKISHNTAHRILTKELQICCFFIVRSTSQDYRPIEGTSSDLRRIVFFWQNNHSWWIQTQCLDKQTYCPDN